MKPSSILSILATLCLFGCASFPETLSARRVEPGDTLVLDQKEILIFGRILFTENGKSKIPYPARHPGFESGPKGASGPDQGTPAKSEGAICSAHHSQVAPHENSVVAARSFRSASLTTPMSSSRLFSDDYNLLRNH